MTRKREFLDYLADIQDAAQHISQFIAGMTWAQFSQDKRPSMPWSERSRLLDKPRRKSRPPYVSDIQKFRDRKSTRLNSSHLRLSRMPSSA